MARVWVSIIGLGEDGLEGLSAASRKAFDAAEIVMGPERHLGLLPETGAERVTWPVPFRDGIERLLSFRGKSVAVLASGDPFWHGAGRVIAEALEPGEWQAFPAPSVFSLAASKLGWPLETTTVIALHAAPFERIRPHLWNGARIMATLRDGGAALALAKYLDAQGFGETQCHILEALGGPRERINSFKAASFAIDPAIHPVSLALQIKGGKGLVTASGHPDDFIESDGQMTKRPVRALTLSALAPRPGERLWDIGGGSGSVAIEWLLSHPANTAVAIERRDDRAERIVANAVQLGQDRLQVVTGDAPAALENLPTPDAVFIGGGLSDALIDHLWTKLPTSTRIVANAVTLETEAIILAAQKTRGGSLLKVELSEPAPIGGYQGWKAAYPILQWTAVTGEGA